MTIAIGVLARDGLVIAADTEESDGFLKTTTSKVKLNIRLQADQVAAHLPGGAVARSTAVCAVTGAGTSSLIESLGDRLVRTGTEFADQSDDAVLGAIQSVLEPFHRDHVVPFSGWPLQERPDVSLIVGITNKTQNRLYSTERTLARKCAPVAAVGIGGMMAHSLLRRLGPRIGSMDLSADDAVSLVAYVLFQVKESVPGCGKLTEMTVLMNGRQIDIPWIVLRNMETVFIRHARLEARAIRYAFSGDDPNRQKRAAIDLRAAFAAFRKEFEPVEFVGAASQQEPPALRETKRGRRSEPPSRG